MYVFYLYASTNKLMFIYQSIYVFLDIHAYIYVLICNIYMSTSVLYQLIYPLVYLGGVSVAGLGYRWKRV